MWEKSHKKNVYAHVRLGDTMEERPVNVGAWVVVRDEIDESTDDYDFVISLQGQRFLVTKVVRDSYTNRIEECYVVDEDDNELTGTTGHPFPFYVSEIRRADG
jgi:hypothetical protein